MTDAVVFNGIHTLDFHEVRWNVVRIPEVSVRISEAQEIWDKEELSSFNFYNFLVSEDQVFQGNIKLKSLATAIVQVGLYDRYLRFFQRPKYLIGAGNGDSPLKVAAGLLSLEDLLKKSRACEMERPSSLLQLADTPFLSGMSLADYTLYVFSPQKNTFETLIDGNKDFNVVAREAIEEHRVQKFVNIGPGSLLINRNKDEYSMADIQILESIDIDPMLSWFWREVQQHEVPQQQMAQ